MILVSAAISFISVAAAVEPSPTPSPSPASLPAPVAVPSPGLYRRGVHDFHELESNFDQRCSKPGAVCIKFPDGYLLSASEAKPTITLEGSFEGNPVAVARSWRTAYYHPLGTRLVMRRDQPQAEGWTDEGDLWSGGPACPGKSSEKGWTCFSFIDGFKAWIRGKIERWDLLPSIGGKRVVRVQSQRGEVSHALGTKLVMRFGGLDRTLEDYVERPSDTGKASGHDLCCFFSPADLDATGQPYVFCGPDHSNRWEVVALPGGRTAYVAIGSRYKFYHIVGTQLTKIYDEAGRLYRSKRVFSEELEQVLDQPLGPEAGIVDVPDVSPQKPEGFKEQGSYQGDCTHLSGSLKCLEFGDGFVWLVDEPEASIRYSEGGVAEAVGSASVFRHVMGSKYVKKDKLAAPKGPALR